ncbi:hypothetical protein HYR69_10665, partial [Candidatus Sumerlaeota bacterium]|nr:hypothetical protein [Candidatus Sumerlaeota bacterium]
MRPVSANPNSGSGELQTFTFQFFDANGPNDFVSGIIQIGPALASSDYTGTCTFRYLRANNRVELSSGPGTWIGDSLGGPANLQNQQCQINAHSTSAVWTGNALTFTVGLTFFFPIAGPNQIWMDAIGASSESGWLQNGTWTAPAPANFLSSISSTPSSGTGAAQAFTFRYADSSGGDQIQRAWVQFTPSYSPSNTAHTCEFYNDRAAHKWNLLADDGITWIRTNPGTLLENSQCW